MAITSTKTYCTDRDLLDVFPGIAGYDLKKRIYNWTGPTANIYTAQNTGEITQLFADGIELTSDASLNGNNDYYYTDTTNSVQFYHTANNPNDMIMEAGDDWETIKTRFRQKASRMIEARLDAKLTKDIWYDREKNYPDIVVRLTALETIILLISAHEPNNEFLESFKSERNELLEGLNNGTVVLPSMRTKDSSEGSIRTVAVNAASDLIPVELTGNYHGGGYELLKVFINTSEGGLIGVAKMTVHGKSSTKLKDGNKVLVDSEIIDGDYQSLGVSGLYIRWGGDDVASAVCTAADEYEIELYAKNLGTSVATNHGSIHLTRR